MRAEYDTEADALSIDLIEAQRWEGSEPVDEHYCNVALVGGRVANIELLAPRRNLALLNVAAQRHHLDAEALEAAARSPLAAPDRPVILDVLAGA